MIRRILIGTACSCVLLTTSEARAAVVWTGDFETADLSQWTFVANGQYAWPQTELVAEGQYAAWLELHDDATWPNGLRRVELQHRPADERTAEGATTYFAWSFYLPEALPDGTNQAIGYWESNNTWQQVMALNAHGQDLVFATRRPMNVVQWQGYGMATPGEWHRVAMGVTWSTNPGQGTVSVWFDGELVVDGAQAQTLADGNPHFVQVGLLRDVMGFVDVPVIVLDDAVEGDALEDVRPDDLPSAGGDDGGGSSSGGAGEGSDGDGGLDTSGGGSDPSGGSEAEGPGAPDEDGTTAGTVATSQGEGGDAGAGSTSGAGADETDAGCGCRARSGTGATGMAGWAGLFALLGWRRRRGRPRPRG